LSRIIVVIRVVPLYEFDKAEIRNVVLLLASMPAVVSPKIYDILTSMVFLLFRMALVNSDQR